MKAGEARALFERACSTAKPGAERLNIVVEPKLLGVQLDGTRVEFWTPTAVLVVDGKTIELERRKP